MKKYLLILLAVFVLTGCSDDDDNTAAPNPAPQENVAVTSSYKIMINGEEFKLDTSRTFKALRNENMFSIGFMSNTQLTFDHKGRLGRLAVTRLGSPTKKFYSHFDNSAQHFAFDMVALDTIRRRVSGSFSGYLNIDPINFSNEGKFVSGTFDVAYVDVPAPIKGLRHKARINGDRWQMTNSYFTKGEANDNNNILIHNLMDNEYKIMFGYNAANYAVGTYSFTPASHYNMVRLAKYNNNTLSYVYYNTSGTLTVTQKESLGGTLQIVSGVYTATAVNPENSSDVIQITNGDFKFITPNTSQPSF